MILGEFAINPEVIEDWTDLRILSMRFGFEHGAVISDFPKPWISSLKQRAEQDLKGTRKYLSVIEQLNRIKKEFLINRARTYDVAEDWVNNAVTQHEAFAFYKIIDINAAKGVDAFCDIDEKLFEGLREGSTHRHAEDLAQVACLLLENSKKIKIIDPFISPHRGCQKSIKEIINVIQRGNRAQNIQLELHTSSSRSGKDVDVANEKTEIETIYQPLVSAGMSLRVYWWKDDETNELHPRYLVTERGGMRYDRGFIEPNELSEKDSDTDVSMMTQERANEVWGTYTPEASKYEVIDTLGIIGK